MKNGKREGEGVIVEREKFPQVQTLEKREGA